MFNTVSIKAAKGWSYIGLGFTLMQKNDWIGSHPQISLGLKAARESRDKSITVGLLIGFAGVDCTNENEKTAANLLGAADALAPVSGYITHCLLAWVTNEVKQKLGEALFGQEFRNGRRILLEKAIQMI